MASDTRILILPQAFYLQQQATLVVGSKEHSLPGLKLHYYPSLSQSSEESEGTKRCATGCTPPDSTCPWCLLLSSDAILHAGAGGRVS